MDGFGGVRVTIWWRREVDIFLPYLQQLTFDDKNSTPLHIRD